MTVTPHSLPVVLVMRNLRKRKTGVVPLVARRGSLDHDGAKRSVLSPLSSPDPVLVATKSFVASHWTGISGKGLFPR